MKNALVSVSDKKDLKKLCEFLSKQNINLIASGGTAALLSTNNIPHTKVSDFTSQPELLNGRVKTLHPAIHSGILATSSQSDAADMDKFNFKYIDYVICNLYPFKNTVASGCVLSDAVEQIDIGGVTLLRAAAKNFNRVTVVSDPADYDSFMSSIEAGQVTLEIRKQYALKAFIMTQEYDQEISTYFKHEFNSDCVRQLRYGANPHQTPAHISFSGTLPFRVLSGAPGYINFLDALNAWALVKELYQVLGKHCAASFKHVSPAGVAVEKILDDTERCVYDVVNTALSPLASAYARARGADRMSSFGDFVALSSTCDLETAKLLSREVSDGVIAPGFSPDALEVLQKKKGGKYVCIQIDREYTPPDMESRQVFGLTLSQKRNDKIIDSNDFRNVVGKVGGVSESCIEDLIVASVALKYTQSNSVCYAKNGMTVGIGADCTRLAGDKADIWWYRHHPKVLSLPFVSTLKRAERANAIDQYVNGYTVDQNLFTSVVEPLSEIEKKEWIKQSKNVVLSSDAFFPFSDNVERAAESGVSVIAAPSGSVMDEQVIEKANDLGIAIIHTNTRLFHH